MSKIVVITGANRGIGLALSTLYRSRGYEVYAACRKPSEELQDSGAHVIDKVDVTTELGRERLQSALKDKQIDILVNNAGILQTEALGAINSNADKLRAQFETNAIAPLLVTESLLDRLGKGAKVVMMTSRMGSMEDNTSGGHYGYRMSKAALNAASKSLAVDLKKRGVAVAILHPGFVSTEMVGGQGEITATQAAERLAQRIDELDLESTGNFRHSNGDALPW